MGASGQAHLAALAAPGSVDISCAKSFECPLLRLAADALKWTTSRAGGTVVWVQGKENMIEKLSGLRSGEYLSHIPGLGVLTQKVPLAEALQAAGASFWPRTWCVPEVSLETSWIGIRRMRHRQGQSLESVCKEAFAGKAITVIVKPNGGSQGKDIALARSSTDLCEVVTNLPKPSAIIQQYIERPLLLEGYKWDARVYAMIMALPSDAGHKFTSFLALDGLVRLATEPYEEPRPRNLHRINAHLTNYSLNKISPKFVHTDDPDNGDHGSKRRLAAVLERIEATGAGTVKVEETWRQLGSMIRQCVDAIGSMVEGIAFDPSFWAEGGSQTAELVKTKFGRCFHIIGLDVIIDEAGKPWLLEINSAPSMDISEVIPLPDEGCMVPPETIAADQTQDLGSGYLRKSRRCRCGALVKPHRHRHSPVDLAVKLPVMQGAFEIVSRARHDPNGDHARWAEGTIYRPL